MSNGIVTQHHQTFESIKQVSTDGGEFWFARELQGVLDYNSWDKFERVLQKAITACLNSQQPENDHFSQVEKMVEIGSGAQRKTHANQPHHEVGNKVRQTIQDLGGTMPEDLPVPQKGIKQLAREQKKLEGKKMYIQPPREGGMDGYLKELGYNA